MAFVRAAQRVGLSLEEITDVLALLPADRAPTKAEWRRLSRSWRSRLDERIVELERLRDDLTSCIGCGCLSLASCRLSNPQDAAGGRRRPEVPARRRSGGVRRAGVEGDIGRGVG